MRILLCICIISVAPSVWAESYGLADLQALEKQGSFEELVEHLSDVPPTKRDAIWTGLAERGGAGYLSSLKLDEKSADKAIAWSDRLLQKYPALKQSKLFMGKRAEVGMKAFGFTFSNYRHSAGDDEWLDKLKEFVKSDGVTADLPQQAARRVQKVLVAECAWPFWKMALDRGAALCKDADFQKAILGAIEDGVWKSETEPVAQNKCWNDLKAPMQAGVEKGSFDYRKHVCPLLKAKSVTLTPEQTAKCDL
jgi:hypothetical protein